MEKLKLCGVSIALLMLVRFCSAHECTVNPDEIRSVRLEAVKWEILLKLRFIQPPKNPDPNVPLIISQSLLAEYRAVKELLRINGKRDPCVTVDVSSQHLLIFLLTSVEKFSGGQGRIVFDSDQGVLVDRTADSESVADSFRLKFFINVSNGDIISHAELRLLKRPRTRPNSQPTIGIGEERVELYLISRPNNFFGGEFPEFITAQQVSSDTEGLVVLDILDVIKKWVEFDSTNFARLLELEVVIRSVELIETGMHYQPELEFVFNETTQVVITTYKDRLSSRRKKRASDAESCMQERRHTCCVRPLEINFREDFGWHWVIYPGTIEINYCEGLCPFSLQNYHSLILALNPTSSPTPCCVPVVFEPINILIFVNRTAVNEILEDVKVNSCSCR